MITSGGYTKQTAANNVILEEIKRRFNAKIYRKALDIMNSAGDGATLEYVQQFTTSPVMHLLDLAPTLRITRTK